jgi:HD-GYP domain-containing protein (c-di-GMP phosphodiesterase class II)
MMWPRPYRPALPAEQIGTIFTQGAGSQWDPEVVRHFLACRYDLFAICQGSERVSISNAVENAVNIGRRSPSDFATNGAHG